MFIGLYGMIIKNNLIKKIIGMSIFQSAIILFYISTAVKLKGGIPILKTGGHGSFGHNPINIAEYMNPIPHVLMLTAIVVSVATLGVALALAIKIYRNYETLEEDEIREKISTEYFSEN